MMPSGFASTMVPRDVRFIFWGFTILGVRVQTAFAQGWFGLDFHLPLLGASRERGQCRLCPDLPRHMETPQ